MRFPEIGDSFAGKYRIDSMLGSGGFSRVYCATQMDLDRQVAIKILQPPINIGNSPTAQERNAKLESLMSRFEREARMVSKLRCPHTITMYDYGRTEDGQLFMSLEYVDGLTLTELIQKEGRLEPKRVAKIMRQVLMSLFEAHQLGMLHRDIKPQNIMVYEHLGLKDQVKLLDFGIVKLIDQETKKDFADLTSDDTLVGTPRYMSPEYIRGESIGAASDIYSLGLVMYELLVGEQAIQANSSIQIIGKQLERASFYLPRQMAGVDLALRAIIDGMLEKDTQKRYASIDLILADLESREDNKHVPPPNAPRSSLGEPTGQLPGAVTHRMPGIPPMPNLPASGPAMPPAPNLSPAVGFGAQSSPPVETIEPFEVSAPKKSRAGLAIAAIALLLVMGGSAAAIMAMNGASAQATPNEPDTIAVAKPETNSAREPARNEAPETTASVEETERFVITSSPTGARITLNDEPMGTTPATITAAKVSFPAIVSLDLDGRTITHTLTTAEDLDLDLPEAKEPPTKEKDLAKSDSQPDRKKRDARSTKTERKVSKKVEKKPEEKKQTARVEKKPDEKKPVEKKPDEKKGGGLSGLPTIEE